MTESPQDMPPDIKARVDKAADKLIFMLVHELFNAPVISYSALCKKIGVNSEFVEFGLEFLQSVDCEINRTKSSIKLVRIGFKFLPVMVSFLLSEYGIDLDIQTFAQTQSTNDECFIAAASGADKPKAMIANVQSKGRGRRGSCWESRPGQSALLSLLLPSCELPAETLSLAAGLAVAESVSELAHRNAELKWPNDVLIDGRKIAGVLIETRPNPQNPARTDYVIGVGVNVMQTHKDFPPDLAARAISLAMIRRMDWDLTNVLVSLLKHLHVRCIPLASGEELVPLWRSRCRMLGRHVRVSHGGAILEGTVADIDPLEGLILRDQQGINHACLTSQTTVLPEQ